MTPYLLIWRPSIIHIAWQYPFESDNNDAAINYARRQIEALTDVSALELWKNPGEENETCVAYIRRDDPKSTVIFNPIPHGGKNAA